MNHKIKECQGKKRLQRSSSQKNLTLQISKLRPGEGKWYHIADRLPGYIFFFTVDEK